MVVHSVFCGALGSLWILSMWHSYGVGKQHGSLEQKAAIRKVLTCASSNAYRNIFYARGFPDGSLKFHTGRECHGLRNARNIESADLCQLCTSWQCNVPELAEAVDEFS